MSAGHNHLFKIPLFNFLIAALFGLLLRTAFVHPIAFNFNYVTHAHSHVAMLGWLYMAFFLLVLQYFVGYKRKVYKWLFWGNEVAIIGMAVSFPFQGYALFSIIFSTLYILLSYGFGYFAWKDLRHRTGASSKLMRMALFWLVFSTISLWAMGPVMATMGKEAKLGQLIIQFFLHFQLNGWFLFAVMALFFKLLKIKETSQFNKFLFYLSASLVLTVALPINWYYDYAFLRWINAMGIILQVVAVIMGISLVKNPLGIFYKKQNKISKTLLWFAGISFLLKILFQSFSLDPGIAHNVFNNRQAVIGFIHLMVLGIISVFIFFLMERQKKSQTERKLYHWGVYFFLSGIVLTEIILLLQGLFYYFKGVAIANYMFWLWLFSFALVIGVDFIFIAQLGARNKKVK